MAYGFTPCLGSAWSYNGDSAKAGTPQVILNGVRTQLTIDGLTALSSEGRLPGVWDTASNTLRPEAEGVAYLLRFDFFATQTVSGNSKSIDLELYIPTAGLDILHRSLLLLKGSGTSTQLSISFPIFTSPLMYANGLEFYLTPDVDVELEQAALSIYRI